MAEKNLVVGGVTSPGKILEEKLQKMNIDVKDLAERIQCPPKIINRILRGKSRITIDVAGSLEYIIDVPISFWLDAQTAYEKELFKPKLKVFFKNLAKWRNCFPVSELKPRNWIEGFVDKDDAILRFFGVAGPKEWENWYCKKLLKVVCENRI